jgi:hypothetical protein
MVAAGQAVRRSRRPGQLDRVLGTVDADRGQQAMAVQARLLGVLSGYLDQGVTVVTVREMLDLLDPRYVLPAEAPRDPLADPLTGAMPVRPEAYLR